MAKTMNVSEFRERLANGELSRRDTTKVLASVGVGMASMTF